MTIFIYTIGMNGIAISFFGAAMVATPCHSNTSLNKIWRLSAN